MTILIDMLWSHLNKPTNWLTRFRSPILLAIDRMKLFAMVYKSNKHSNACGRICNAPSMLHTAAHSISIYEPYTEYIRCPFLHNLHADARACVRTILMRLMCFYGQSLRCVSKYIPRFQTEYIGHRRTRCRLSRVHKRLVECVLGRARERVLASTKHPKHHVNHPYISIISDLHVMFFISACSAVLGVCVRISAHRTPHERMIQRGTAHEQQVVYRLDGTVYSNSRSRK